MRSWKDLLPDQRTLLFDFLTEQAENCHKLCSFNKEKAVTEKIDEKSSEFLRKAGYYNELGAAMRAAMEFLSHGR